MTRYSGTGSVLLLAAVSVALAGGREPKYATPQEAWQAAAKAFTNKDWKAVYGVLTDESREKLTAQAAFLPLMIKGFAKLAPKDKQAEEMAKLKPLDDVLAKHGLTEEVLKKMEQEAKAKGTDKKDPDAMKKALQTLIAPIKDRRAFVGEMMPALQKATGMSKEDNKAFAEAQLKDVKVEGDKARGVLVLKKGDKEQREPIEFRREGGGWRVEMPEPKGKAEGAKEDPPRIKP
jgi:hypothetical protein